MCKTAQGCHKDFKYKLRVLSANVMIAQGPSYILPPSHLESISYNSSFPQHQGQRLLLILIFLLVVAHSPEQYASILRPM